MNLNLNLWLWPALFLILGSKAHSCIPEVHWSDTITFCKGNLLTLSAANPNSTYLWSTGATTPSITLNNSGLVWVIVTNACGQTKDTVHVSADEPLYFSLGSDRNLCSQTNPKLSAPYDPFADYLWQDGSTSHEISATQSGTYWVEVTNGCGVFRDTVQIGIDDPPSPNLGPDINNCNPSTVNLSIPATSGTAVFWSTGSTNSSISINTPGAYWVKLTNACGNATDTVNVTFNQGQSLEIGDTVSKCSNGTAKLVPNVSGGSYAWSTGATTSTITVQNPGLYWLTYTDACGTFSDSAYVVNSGKANVNLGPDTAICDGDVLTLDAGSPGATFNWMNAAGSRFFSVNSAGTYWVSVDNGCGASYDTISISVIPQPDPESIDDTAFYCPGGSVEVDAGLWGPNTGYLWDNGATSQKQTFSSPGYRWVAIYNECDSLVKNFLVEPILDPYPKLGPDTLLCGTNLTLHSRLWGPGHDFLWSTGGKDSTQKVSSTGEYWVEVTNACGVFRDTVWVDLMHPPATSGQGLVKFCSGGQATLTLPFIDSTTYLWSTGQTSNQIIVNTPGTYTVEARNRCDTIQDTIEVLEVFPLNVDLGPDTTFCEPAILYLDMGPYKASNVLWSTGSRNAGLPISQSGQYWVELQNVCGTFTDTINVQVNLRPQRKLQDKAICQGNTVQLDASQPQARNYLWNTGATTASITVSQQGWYYVDLMNDCDTVRDSAFVRVDRAVQPFDLGNDTVFCQGSLLLDAGYLNGASYLWQNGGQSQEFLVTQTGTYYVTVTNTCNSYTDSIHVLITGPPQFVLGTEVTFCFSAVLTLNAQNPGSNYLWNTGDTTQTLNVDTAGIYWVSITNDCGHLVDTVDVYVDYPLDDLDIGRDTIICRGEELTLDTKFPRAKAVWNTGAKTRFINVSETGKYWVEVTNKCGEWSDSIYVFVQDIPEFSLGKDSGICAMEGVHRISGPSGMVSYQWSNGDTTAGTEIRTAGNHWLTVRNECFSYTDTIFLKEEYPIELDLGNDTTLCNGETLMLNPGDVGYKLRWNKREIAAAEFPVTKTGTYWVKARNPCGEYSDTVHVFFDFPIEEPVIDTTICREDSAAYKVPDVRYEVNWFDGSTKPVRYFPEEGSYFFTVTNKCGEFDQELRVEHHNCDCPLYIANAFTPNSDGKNDEFRVIHDCPLTDFRLWIFNRWGEIVFYSEDVDEAWDGDFNGKPNLLGSYYYRLEYVWEVYGDERSRWKTGSVNLIR